MGDYNNSLQVMSNDLSRGLFPASEVKLLVVDEAHRAQGDYAYCQVIRELQKCDGGKNEFRVVALSATPGTDLHAVRLVLQNLAISHVELRNEESPDIVPYTFQRKIDKIVVKLGDELTGFKNRFLAVMEVFVRRLANKGALVRRGNSVNPAHYTKFGLLQSRDEFRKNPPAGAQPGAVEGDFAAAISLYHAYELLLQQGSRCFYNFVAKAVGDGDGANRRLKYELKRLPAWTELEADLRTKFSKDADNSMLNSSRPHLLSQFGQTSQENSDDDIVLGHPKLVQLRDIVLDHFRRKREEGVETRAMIFSQYRDSVEEITACLHVHRPLIKVMSFVGQAGTKGKRGEKCFLYLALECTE